MLTHFKEKSIHKCLTYIHNFNRTQRIPYNVQIISSMLLYLNMLLCNLVRFFIFVSFSHLCVITLDFLFTTTKMQQNEGLKIKKNTKDMI